MDATPVKSALENRDIVKGIKAHAELGGFARWGIEVIKLAAEIGRKTGLPVYIHFGLPLGPARVRRQWRRSGHHPRPGGAAAETRRHPRASVHAPSGRLRQSRGQGASRREAGARHGPQDRRRPRLALQLPHGAHRTGCRHRSRHARRRHARLQHGACRNRRRRLPARPTSIRTRNTCSSARRASRSSRR